MRRRGSRATVIRRTGSDAMVKVLASEEVDAFWAIGCSLEAVFVPRAELVRAFDEHRVQQASSWSSMGTAETGWTRPTQLPGQLRDCAVVPPGRVGEAWPWDEMLDDRDVDAVLWRPFRAEQHAAIARVVTGPAIDVVLEEAARRLVAIDRRQTPPHPELADWLIGGGAIDPQLLDAELAARRDAPPYLAWGIRARWLERSVSLALAAIAESSRLDGYGADPAPRMDLMQFALRAATCGGRARP